MRVAALPADESGRGFWRVRMPAVASRTSGADVSVRLIDDLEIRMGNTRLPTGKIGTTVLDAWVDAAVVVIQRPLNRHLFEVDDDFDNVHPQHAALPGLMRSPLEQGPHWLHAACRIADLVTVSTPALLDRYGKDSAGHVHGVVVRNYAPTAWTEVDVARDPGRVRVGWSGTVGAHPGDLDVARWGGAARAIAAAGAGFVAVGEDPKLVSGLLKLPHSVPVSNTPWCALEEFPRVLRQKVDVGIVPLENSVFNRSKSWVSGLTYAALGIPYVVSRTPDYDLLASYGLGRPVAGDRWAAELGRMLSRYDQARQNAERARAKVAAELTIEKHIQKWIRAWQTARERADARTGEKVTSG